MSPYVYVPCSKCRAINRVLIERLNAGPHCAKCKAGLSLNQPLEIADQKQFDQVVMESGLPVLVDFWAAWCGPCQSMHSVMEELAGRGAGSYLVARVNTDDFPAISARFGIKGVPTFILFHEGREVSRQVGAVPIQNIESMIQSARA